MEIASKSVHGRYKLAIGAILSLLPVNIGARARVTSATNGIGGPWLLNPGDSVLTVGPFQVSVELNVETLDGDVGVDMTRQWLSTDLLGGDAAVASLKTFNAANQVHRAGYRVLVCWASTGARNNNEFNIREATYQRNASGVVSFQSSPMPDAYVGKVFKIASAQSPWLWAFIRATAVGTDGGTGDTLITGTELYTAPRRAIALGSMSTDHTMVVHDMHCWQNAHSWLQKLNVRCNGMLDIVNLSSGGSDPFDWQDPEARAYGASLGKFDFGIFNFGTGNAFTQPTHSSADIAAAVNDNLTYWSTLVREGFLIGEPGGRLYGDGALSTSPQLTPDFTTLALVTQFGRRHTTDKQPNVVYVDTAHRANAMAMRGAVDLPDLTLGRTPADLTDASGIHWTPAMNDIVAERIAHAMLPRMQVHHLLTMNVVDTVYSNSTADFGAAYNGNALGGWAGNIATVPVIVNGLVFAGNGPDGTTADCTGATGNMGGYIEVVGSKRRGRELRLHFTDPVDGGITFNTYLRKIGGRSILSVLNDAQFQGVDLTWWLDMGLMGFNANTLANIDFSLYATGPSGTHRLAGWYCPQGNNGMFGAKRAWYRGFNGLHRSSPFRAPAETLTDAWLQFTFIGISPTHDDVTLSGDGTTVTGTTSALFNNFLGTVGDKKGIQITGATNTNYNVQAIATVTGETTFTFPCTATGAPGGTPKVNQSFPVGELMLRIGEGRLAKDQLLVA